MPSPDDAADLTQERVAALLAAAPRVGEVAFDVTVLASTGSTNADVLARFARGEAGEGTVVAAAEQVQGRGRLDRTWESPRTGSLSFSVLLRPPMERAGFVSPLTAVAVARAVKQASGLTVSLKWPNDVLVSADQREGKIAGILAEGVPGAVVVGCGINVAIPAEQLPVPTATSLQLHGAALDRAGLLVACLVEIGAGYTRWRDAGFSADASGLLAAYRGACGTIGRRVRVMLPGGTDLFGLATGIDDLGRLLLRTDDGETALAAGDVVHLRPTAAPDP